MSFKNRERSGKRVNLVKPSRKCGESSCFLGKVGLVVRDMDVSTDVALKPNQSNWSPPKYPKRDLRHYSNLPLFNSSSEIGKLSLGMHEYEKYMLIIYMLCVQLFSINGPCQGVRKRLSTIVGKCANKRENNRLLMRVNAYIVSSPPFSHNFHVLRNRYVVSMGLIGVGGKLAHISQAEKPVSLFDNWRKKRQTGSKICH